MPPWILIVLVAHLLNAFAFLVDKFLLSRAVPKPAVYAFSVGALGGIAALLLAFDPQLPTFSEALLDIGAGASFVFALLCFFTALRDGEASRVVPFVGGTIPVYTLLLSYLFLGERLAMRELVAFAVLVVAAALIAREASTRRHYSGRAYVAAAGAAVSFAISSVLMKAVFIEQSFLAGFAWTRIAAFAASCAILLHAASRRAIFSGGERPRGRSLALFIGGQVSGAVGFLGLNYAIALASVTIVNALQGIQYAILFVFVVVLGRWFPQLRERLSPAIVLQKIVAIVLIAVGLALLGSAST